METSPSLSSANPAPPANPEDRIRHLPEAAQAAFRKFRAEGDVTTLDPLLFAILENYAPRKSARPLAEVPGTTLLMDDLGFDSLAITEIVFFTEELFEITIANEELIRVRTLDDLRGFIQRKVRDRPSA